MFNVTVISSVIVFSLIIIILVIIISIAEKNLLPQGDATILINNDEYNFMIELINKLPLPKLDGLDYDQIIQYINFDKKYQNGKLSFILLNGLGSTEIATDISQELIRKSLKVLQWKLKL